MPDIQVLGEVKKMNGNCNCYSTSNSGRGFLTKAEKVEMLKEYKEQLDLESKGVGERIKDMQKQTEGNEA